MLADEPQPSSCVGSVELLVAMSWLGQPLALQRN